MKKKLFFHSDLFLIPFDNNDFDGTKEKTVKIVNRSFRKGETKIVNK